MYGSPDDGSIVSRPNTPSVSATISDSDLVRDAKHVHWHPLTYIPDTAGSLRSDVVQDVSAVQPNKRFQGVRAKIKAVARFLSSSKEQGDPASAEPLSEVSDSEDTCQTQTCTTHVGSETQDHQVHNPQPDRSDVKAGTDQREAIAVLEAIRERLDPERSSTSTLHPLPPLPQLPRPPTPISPRTAAMIPKARHVNGIEDALGKGRPDFAKMRAAASRPAVPPPVRSVSRPLPPTPVLAPTPRFAKVDSFKSYPLQTTATGLGVFQDKRRDDQFARVAAQIHTHGDGARIFEKPRHCAKHDLDPTRLADELSSLVSSSTRRRKPRSDFSSDTTRLADSSREAHCGWRAPPSPGFPRQETFGQVQAHASSAATSIFAIDSEPEAIKRIQAWRVHVTSPPSMIGSQCASAHSALYTDGGLSSHLTSISRSPLSKGNKIHDQLDDPNGTPVPKPRALFTGERHAKEKRGKEDGIESNLFAGDEGRQGIGTRHIARLTDSQFERLARTTDALPPHNGFSSDSTSILGEAPTVDPAHNLDIKTQDEERRSSVDAARTTLSVLEHRASPHIEVLDSMIRRHPDKMYKLFQKRPGLMLVFLLRCKIEDRLSQVPSLFNPQPTKTTLVSDKEIDLLEASLIDLHFDADPVEPKEKSQKSQKQDKDAGVVPSIVVSHATGSTPTDSGTTPQATQTRDTSPEETAMGSNKTLHEIVCRLEKAGELCTMQHALIAMQNRLMNTSDTCTQLSDRLSKLEQAVFSPPSVSYTPSTSFSMQV